LPSLSRLDTPNLDEDTWSCRDIRDGFREGHVGSWARTLATPKSVLTGPVARLPGHQVRRPRRAHMSFVVQDGRHGLPWGAVVQAAGHRQTRIVRGIRGSFARRSRGDNNALPRDGLTAMRDTLAGRRLAGCRAATVRGVADVLLGFVAGLVIASLTAPVGVSGAVFLLPVQLSVLHVPNPAVTPTNLLYNIIATPGALLRYRSSGQLTGSLARRLVAGAVPGVLVGAVIRVFVLPGERPFRLAAGVVLFSIGVWLIRRTAATARARPPLSTRRVTALAAAAGVVGGIYGVGGGSLVSPVLVGSGMSVRLVAPAALASTFVTSVVGALAFVVLAVVADSSIAPDWRIGIACGLGGICGGYIGARVQPHVPERVLRLMLGAVAIAIAAMYLIQGIS
jgi:uncharacterized protein